MTDGQLDGRMEGQTGRWKRAGKTGRDGRTGRGREDKNGLPEHECCPREAS